MRIKVPVIGTVIESKPMQSRPEIMEVYGAEDDPIHINVDLGNVSWTLVDLDIENGLAEIEVTPAEEVSEDTGQTQEEWVGTGETESDGKPIFVKKTVPIIVTRPTTGIEKQALLDNAKIIVDGLDKTNRLIRKDK